VPVPVLGADVGVADGVDPPVGTRLASSRARSNVVFVAGRGAGVVATALAVAAVEGGRATAAIVGAAAEPGTGVAFTGPELA
jgi:hypothetical protein